MPFYEYECGKCRYYVEVMQKLSDAPLKKCPSCGKNALKKLISAPVFRLKGSGWYETDFKSDQEHKRNLVGNESEPAPAPAADKASDKSADKAAPGKDSKAESPAAAKSESAAPKPEPAAASRRSGGRADSGKSARAGARTGKSPPAKAAAGKRGAGKARTKSAKGRGRR